jgi:hypothetical protein
LPVLKLLEQWSVNHQTSVQASLFWLHSAKGYPSSLIISLLQIFIFFSISQVYLNPVFSCIWPYNICTSPTIHSQWLLNSLDSQLWSSIMTILQLEALE